MRDIEIELKMKNKEVKVKSDLDKKIDREIEAYLDFFSKDMPVQNSLISPTMQRNKLKCEIEEEMKLRDYTPYIEGAFKCLLFESKKYLDEDHFNHLQASILRLPSIIEKLDLSKERKGNFLEDLMISEDTLASINLIATNKFNENNFADSLSLFILLSMIVPSIEDYWFRAGIAAHQCENFNLAVKLYASANEVNPNLIGARLFASECYFRNGAKEEAKLEFEEARKIKESNGLDSDWSELFNELDKLLKI